ncbi:MAG: alpha/beta-type small acid-soluble spore protein [Firmicutes bacterium]|nr:alpha/beta-type small acid-soluble spore protein [Bacillota bacterium]MCL5038888.1 alpha/beta-type small acid-soluble spore protein [Bacillota bacterium]
MARRRPLLSGAERGLHNLKLETVREIALPVPAAPDLNQTSYQEFLDRAKLQVAQELGLDDEIRRLGWAQMPSRELGRIGGRTGGAIGGHMVRKMIALAEQRLGQNRGQMG